VKQSDKVGRPDIDAFEAVLEREGEGGRQRGFFVSFALMPSLMRPANGGRYRRGARQRVVPASADGVVEFPDAFILQ
jgi:hypothetical protein